MSEQLPKVGPRAVEYKCDGVVSIRLCEGHDFSWGHAPEYWYIRRPLYVMDEKVIGMSREEIRDLKALGFNVLYWIGDRWRHHTPKQFTTHMEAFRHWQSWSRDKQLISEPKDG